MKRLFEVLFALLLAVTAVQAKNYAVLITGDTPTTGYTRADGTWQIGAYSSGTNYDEFWNDTYLMWQTLFDLGWKDENIFVLYSGGVDWPDAADQYDVYSNYWNDYSLGHIVDYRARYSDVQNMFTWLANGNTTEGIPQVSENDNLFIWTFGHGGDPDDNGGYGTLKLENDTEMPETDFSNYLDQISCNKRIVVMEQCFGGSFVDALENSNTIILTAADETERAWRADNLEADGDSPNVDPYENEVVNGNTYSHGEFNYHVMNATLLETVYYGHSTASADINSDGLASIQETGNWMISRNSYKELEPPGMASVVMHPQYSDLGNLGSSTYLDIPPDAPTNLTLSGSAGSHPTLTWTAPANPDVKEFQIKRQVQSMFGGWSTQYITVTTTSWTDYSFSIGGAYRIIYSIRTRDNANQYSTFSSTVSTTYSGGIDSEGSGLDISLNSSVMPVEFTLNPPAPNPFNASTTIRLGLPEASPVTLAIYDIQGRLVTTLMDGETHGAGWHIVSWNARDVASGTYFLLAKTNGQIWNRKLTVIK